MVIKVASQVVIRTWTNRGHVGDLAQHRVFIRTQDMEIHVKRGQGYDDGVFTRKPQALEFAQSIADALDMEVVEE